MKPVCSLLALVVTLLLFTATSGDSDAVESITAVLGHSVTFRCPSKHSTPVERLYIVRVKNDKEEDFINGFYIGRVLYVLPEYRDRTKVNVTELSMEMRNISVSDEGLYKCLVFINNKPEISKILLKVTGDSDAVESITAVLGHSVTFRCSSKHSTPAEHLYIQKVKNDKEEFINGFYRGQMVDRFSEYRDRTKVNVTELSMEMRNISVSDEGLYKCVVFINNKPEISKFLLKVTAEYSIPTITKECNKPGDGGAGKSCQLSCSAVGGYPQSTVRWTGLNQSLTNVIYNLSSADNESKTWTINQTIVHNCNQPTNISCAVGGSVSHTITICETESFPFVVIVAIAVVLVFVLLLIFVVVMCCFRGPQRDDGAGETGVRFIFSTSER